MKIPAALVRIRKRLTNKWWSGKCLYISFRIVCLFCSLKWAWITHLCIRLRRTVPQYRGKMMICSKPYDESKYLVLFRWWITIFDVRLVLRPGWILIKILGLTVWAGWVSGGSNAGFEQRKSICMKLRKRSSTSASKT